MALIADAGHNLSDVFGLLVAWGAATRAKRRPNSRFTYGFTSSSILAALTNFVVVMAVSCRAVLANQHQPGMSGSVSIASCASDCCQPR